MGTRGGKHLGINIPANLPLHLPFIKAALKLRVDVGMRGELGAATPQAPWASVSSCWIMGHTGIWQWDRRTSQQPAPGRNLALKSNYVCRPSSFVLAAVNACAAFAFYSRFFWVASDSLMAVFKIKPEQGVGRCSMSSTFSCTLSLRGMPVC